LHELDIADRDQARVLDQRTRAAVEKNKIIILEHKEKNREIAPRTFMKKVDRMEDVSFENLI